MTKAQFVAWIEQNSEKFEQVMSGHIKDMHLSSLKITK